MAKPGRTAPSQGSDAARSPVRPEPTWPPKGFPSPVRPSRLRAFTLRHDPRPQVPPDQRDDPAERLTVREGAHRPLPQAFRPDEGASNPARAPSATVTIATRTWGIPVAESITLSTRVPAMTARIAKPRRRTTMR